MEQKRDELLQCQNLLRERIAAPIPAGPTNTKQIGTSSVIRDDITWIYPPELYISAGGACGGMVCSAWGAAGMLPTGVCYLNFLDVQHFLTWLIFRYSLTMHVKGCGGVGGGEGAGCGCGGCGGG